MHLRSVLFPPSPRRPASRPFRRALAARLLLGSILFAALVGPAQSQGQDFVVDIYPGLSNLSSSTWKVGDSIKFDLTITNASWFVGIGAFDFGIYYSADSKITTGDVQLGKARCNGIGWGQYVRYNGLNVQVGKDWLRHGTGYLGVIVDLNNEIAETNEGNNSASSAVTGNFPYTDPAPHSLTVPSTVQTGTTVIVSFQISNRGGLEVSSLISGLFASSNSEISTSDSFLGMASESLDAHAIGRLHRFSVRVPCSMTPGTRYFGVYTDYGDWQTNELSESNNKLAKAFTLSPASTRDRVLEYLPSLYDSTRSHELAELDGRYGGSANICMLAPGLPKGYALLIWSFSSPWQLDGASTFSLSLINNSAFFPGWFRQLGSDGRGIAQFRLPRGTPISGTLNVYTQGFFWNERFEFRGVSNDLLKTRLSR
jgi:hypothetical protein